VRIISATNRDLIADVKNGRFREDLFYRLHVFPISVPALAERPEDVPELARHFLARFAAEEGKRVRSVTPEALALLTAYRWPGNVRQLENAVFRAVVLAEGDEIGVAEFPQIAQSARAQVPMAPRSAPPDAAPGISATTAPAWPERAAADPGGIAPHPPAFPLLDAFGEVRTLEDVESEVIRFAIAHYRGQMSEVARRLQIGRSTLYRKLDNLGLAAEETSDQDAVVAG
jgi:DNA-binding NtrC family response regulator